jgi:hypothetical protein
MHDAKPTSAARTSTDMVPLKQEYRTSIRPQAWKLGDHTETKLSCQRMNDARRLLIWRSPAYQ